MQIGNYTLFPLQERAVEGLRESFRKGHKHVILQAPCGFGKTVVSSAVIRLLIDRGKKVLFVANRRQLIFQKSRKLTECGIQHTVLMSGEDYSHSPVVVASKDTLWERCYKTQKIQVPQADVVIVDECHEGTTGASRTILEPYPLVIGMTATPAGANGKGLGPFYEEIVVGAKYSELLAERLLVPVRCFSPYRPDLEQLDKTGNDYTEAQTQDLMDKQELIGDVFKHWKMLASDRPTVIFATGVQHSIHLMEEFRSKGINTEHIDADTPPEERQAIFDAMNRGAVQVLCNCAVLTTGWDQPIVSCGVIAKPTRRLTTYLQMAGRILRFHPNKKDAILIDHAGAVHAHGWPTDDNPWELNPEQKIEERVAEIAEKEKKTREKYCCPKCAAMWENGNSCPSCGFVHKKRGQPVQMKDGTLRELKRKKKKKPQNDKQKTWMACLGIAARRGMTFNAAAGIFKNKTGEWPDGMTPMPDYSKRTLPVAQVYPGFARGKQ